MQHKLSSTAENCKDEREAAWGALLQGADHVQHVIEAKGSQADHVGQVVGLRRPRGAAVQHLGPRQHLLQRQNCPAGLGGVPCDMKSIDVGNCLSTHSWNRSRQYAVLISVNREPTVANERPPECYIEHDVLLHCSEYYQIQQVRMQAV